MGVLMVVMAVVAPMPSQPGFPLPHAAFRGILALGSLLYLLPAIWGIASGIGLFRMKNWARISTIVFSVLLILMGGFDFLMSLFIPFFPTRGATPNPVDPAIMSAIRIGMAGFWVGLMGIGIWWLVYLTRQGVKQQFVPVSAMPTASAMPLSADQLQQYQGQPAPIAPSKPERPLSFTILAWFLLVCCLFVPLSVALHAPGMFLTKVLTGWPATIYNLTLAAVLLYIGIGLLRFKPLARSVAVGYFVFAFVNSAAFLLAPGRHARLQYLLEQQQAMMPWFAIWQNQFQPQIDLVPLLTFSACAGLIPIAVILYFLITRKQAFEMAARASAPSVA
jgi:hypothetical protein